MPVLSAGQSSEAAEEVHAHPVEGGSSGGDAAAAAQAHVPPVRVRTHVQGSPPQANVEGGDLAWGASGPFRGPPIAFVLHSTPPGTPQASPRGDSGLPGDGGGDLEAPLLLSNGAKRTHAPFAGPDAGGMVQAVVLGLINTAAGVPALIAFCTVVFKDPMYEPWLDPLSKLFYLSSAVHQAVVSLRSAVPHAVGQVQDVGLIFLSAMASSIASACAREGLDAAAALGTALLTMAACTMLTGLGLVAVAKLKLASAVNLLPLPAVGGYLSYVGYFCVASGLGLGCGIQLGTLRSWALLWDVQTALRVLPTLGSCALMMLTTRHCKHPLALPATLALIVAAFHLVLLAAGVSLEQAQAAGWVLKAAKSTGHFWDLWRMFDMPGLSLARLYPAAALQQVGKLLGLFLLVCFGSCMDIAAIQSDTPFRLDFNAELAALGLSNIASGALGAGFTGSFIFSQTIFTGRAGVHSRLNGAVITLCELCLFALPFSIVQYAPTFFFGSLLVWFGAEIIMDWMWRSYSKLTGAEYCMLWLTFAAIMQWGLEAGIAAGVVLTTFFFAWSYAQSQLSSFELVPGRSRIVRAADQEAVLELLRPHHLVSSSLRGFLFFGIANAISTRVHEAAQSLESGPGGAGARASPGRSSSDDDAQQVERLYAGSSKHDSALFATAAAPRFLLLDLSLVKGMDATSARTLATLLRDLVQLDISPVVTAAGPCRSLLLAHGAPLPPTPARSADDASPFLLRSAPDLDVAPQQHCYEFVGTEEGLRFCEQQLLAVAGRYGLCRPPSEAIPLEQLLQSHASQAGLPFASKEGAAAAAADLLRYCHKLRARPGDMLWREGQPSDELFIVEQGRVTVEQRVATPGAARADAQADERRQQQHRVFVFGPGSVAGAVDFYLHRPRSSSAVVGHAGGGAGGASCRLLRLTRDSLGHMAAESPGTLHILQAVVVRAKCLDLGMAAELAVAGR